MANTDWAKGLFPVGTVSGGPISTIPFIVTTGLVVRRGQLLIAVAAGTVQQHGTVDSGAILVGVSADFVDDSGSTGGKIVNVYCDPGIIYGVQVRTEATPSLANAIFTTSDFQVCTKSGVTSASQVSNTELMLDGGGAALVIGKVETPDNAWGAHVDVLVVLHETIFISGAVNS